LSALLGEEAPEQASSGPPALAPKVLPNEVAIELLRRNPDQPRRHFDEAELDELSESIREHGVLQAILVRPAPGASGEYQIVAGERRWRAAQRANLPTVPVLIRELSDSEVAEISIVENVQRADLNPLEEAMGYKALLERFGRTQETVAKTVGKSRSHVANALRLLNLPEAVREHVSAGRLSAGHARAIVSAPDAEKLAKTIIDGDLSVRQAEVLARDAQIPSNAGRTKDKSKADDARGGRSSGKDSDIRALEQDLSEILGLKVEISDRSGKGELRINYVNLEELDDICRRLSGAAEA
jgi:ParB family chromosome partitioning protein